MENIHELGGEHRLVIVKRYYAEDMQEAMATIRAELGADAVILSSKPVRKKGITGFFQKKELEVIAAYEPRLETPKVREERENAAYQAAIQAVQDAQERVVPQAPSPQQPSKGIDMNIPPVSPGAPLGPIDGRSRAQTRPPQPGNASGYPRPAAPGPTNAQSPFNQPARPQQPQAQTVPQGFPAQGAPGQAVPQPVHPMQSAHPAQSTAPQQTYPPQGARPDVPAGQSAAARAAAQYHQTASRSHEAQAAPPPSPYAAPYAENPNAAGSADGLPFEVEDLENAAVNVVLSRDESMHTASAAERSREAFANITAGQASPAPDDFPPPSEEAQAMLAALAAMTPKDEYELADPAAVARAVPIASALTQEESSRLDALDQKLNALSSMIESFAKKYEYIRHDNDYKYDPEIEPYLMKLLDNDVEQELAHALSRATQESFRAGQSPRQTLEELLRGVIGPAAPLSLTEGRPVVLFMGPTGVGKTTTLVKLATMCSVRDRRKVGLINTDTYRIAAQEQLRTYAEILDVPLKVVYSPTDLSAAIADMRDREVIFVDTAGKRPGDPQHRADMIDLMMAAGENAVPVLAVSAPTSQRSMRELFEHYDFLEEYSLVLTKTDETSGWGAAINACHLSGMPVAYITGGQSVPDDIEQADANELIRRLLR